MGRAGFELSRQLPCDDAEAVEVLGEVRDWLLFRARLHLIVALVMAAALYMGLVTAAALAGIGVWAWRGSLGLARDAEGLAARIGMGRLEDYCGVSVLVALAKYRMEEEGFAGKGRGVGGRA